MPNSMIASIPTRALPAATSATVAATPNACQPARRSGAMLLARPAKTSDMNVISAHREAVIQAMPRAS
jgi:hypothetical protein